MDTGKGPLQVQIRRSVRAKRLRLSVKPGLVELVVPRGAADAQAQAFLDRHRAWAEDKLRELNWKAAGRPSCANFTDWTSVPWRGRELSLMVGEAPGQKARVMVEDCVHILLPGGLGDSRADVALRAFHAWTRRWLHGQVVAWVEHHGARAGLQPRQIRIKRMKTRWGSCGPQNDININWLLALAPESVLEYVVVHELCHIAERNHSRQFWSLVGQHLPEYARQRAWLRSHGAELMRRFCF